MYHGRLIKVLILYTKNYKLGLTEFCGTGTGA